MQKIYFNITYIKNKNEFVKVIFYTLFNISKPNIIHTIVLSCTNFNCLLNIITYKIYSWLSFLK